MSAAKYLVYATILSTFVLIFWGGYLTAGGWGQGCGPANSSAISADWPYCNGSLAIPNPSNPSSYGAFVEYMHRTLSVVTGLFLIAALIAVWRVKPRPTQAARAMLLSFALLIIQIALGDLVVNTSLNTVVTAVHLANATALLGVMVIGGVYMHLGEKLPTQRG